MENRKGLYNEGNRCSLEIAIITNLLLDLGILY